MLFCYWLIVAQIVLESFPISSSSHVKLLELFLQRMHYYVPTSLVWCGDGAITPINVDLLDHLMHGPTVCIIALFFFNRWSILLVQLKRCWPIVCTLIGYTIIADTITIICYFIAHYKPSTPYMLGGGLCITAALLFSLRFCSRTSRSSLTLSTAALLGFAQGCSLLLPGISRLAITYVVARWRRLPPHKACEVSFMIQWPLIVVGCANSVRLIGYQAIVDQFLNLETVLVILGSSILAWYGLRLVVSMMQQHKVWWFAYYMLIPITIWGMLVLR